MHMYVHCGTVYNRKDMKQTQMPISDRVDRENVAYIHHGILCSHKNDAFMSFVGTWMNLETILIKLTQEQKIKHCMFSLIGGCWTMRTHGYREGSIRHWGLLVGNRGGTVGVGRLGRDNMGRNSRYGWQGCKPHCHVCTYATILHVLPIYLRT